MVGTNIATNVYIKLGSSPMALVGESSVSFASAQTMIETSNKTSGNDASFAAGRISRTISVSSIASTDPAATGYGFEEALAAQEDGTNVNFIITQWASGVAVSGTTALSGAALISNVRWEAPDIDKMTFSLDLQVTGEVTVGVNA